jgi:DNA mismatch endonuclease (patch repair protein)
MADVFTPAKRSAVMARIRDRDTGPELALRSMLHRLGFRFTVRGPNNRSLPGKPDLVLPKHRTVVFVHGCFWHGHENCPDFRLPQTRRDWWKEKIEGNRARDHINEKKLRKLGWNVVTVWECEMKNLKLLAGLREKIPAMIGMKGPPA